MQRRVLLGLVRADAATVFGRERDFASIRDEADYFARLPPMSPADFEPHLGAVLEGTPDVLHRGRPVCLGTTSGTGGAAKLVPLHPQLLRQARRSSLDAALLGFADGPTPGVRGRALFIGPRRGRPCGLWMVYEEGAAFSYLHRGGTLLLPRYRDLPAAGEPQDSALLLGLMRGHAVETVAGSPLEIVAFARSSGTTFPGVRRVFNCGWWAADLAPAYREAFPNAAVIDAYGTSEGTYGLPHGEGVFLLNHRRAFFAFVPHEDAPGGVPRPGARQCGLSEVETGRKYQLCATVPGGWWNLATGDLVSFESLRPPLIRLHGRVWRTLPLGADLLTEDAVVAAVRGSGVRSRRYCMVPAEGGGADIDGLELLVDGEDVDAVAVDLRLRAVSDGYRRLRDAGTLRPLASRRAQLPEPAGKPARIVQAPPVAPSGCRETLPALSGRVA